MRTLREYTNLKNRLEEMGKELSRIEEDESFKKELNFLKDIEEVLELHGKTKEEAAEALNPTKHEVVDNGFTKKPRKPRTPRTYQNPHTGETVTTAGGNHTVLKQWRKDNPGLDVSDWIIEQ